jgi:hypothetical protein
MKISMPIAMAVQRTGGIYEFRRHLVDEVDPPRCSGIHRGQVYEGYVGSRQQHPVFEDVPQPARVVKVLKVEFETQAGEARAQH